MGSTRVIVKTAIGEISQGGGGGLDYLLDYVFGSSGSSVATENRTVIRVKPFSDIVIVVPGFGEQPPVGEGIYDESYDETYE